MRKCSLILFHVGLFPKDGEASHLGRAGAEKIYGNKHEMKLYSFCDMKDMKHGEGG